MFRALQLIVIAGLVLTACNNGPSSTGSSPSATADIRRTRLDISYTDLVENDVHAVSSKTVLEAAISAIKAESKRTGGTDDFPALEFQDVSEPVLADFKKFADATAAFAARNTQMRAQRIADAAIIGMINTSPDCHTYYINPDGASFASRPVRSTGTAAQIPSGGTPLGGPDQAGLTGKVLPDGIAYITWRAFITESNYDIADAVRAMLDKAVASGARAWLFDLRGNGGGTGATDAMASWFLNGEPTLTTMLKSGNAGSATAIKALRLPESYQLPMAIILNDRTGSAPEVLTASLKENKRATIVGQKSTGCLGAFYPVKFSDGGSLSVAAQEFVGAVTGAKYNNIGIPPDVPADDATAVAKAIEILTAKIGP
jgi:C-terminal processing protease CtpA/Prc